MGAESIRHTCGNLGSDTTFNKAVEAFKSEPYPKEYWLPWKEADELFKLLPPDMQDILRSLALNEDPCQKVDNSIECLKALGLIEPKHPSRVLQIVKPHFGEYIRLNHTRRGKIERLLKYGWSRGTTIRSHLSTSALVFWAFILLCIPLGVMLPPLLNAFDWVQSSFIAGGIEELVSHARNVALFVTIFLVVYHMFSRFGRRSRRGSLASLLSIPLVVTLTVFWLGFPTHHALLFMILSVVDLFALHLLFQAYLALPRIPSEFENTKLRKLLADTIERDAWSDMKTWPELKLLLMVFLSLTGFLFFGVLLAPREFPLPNPAELGKYLLIAPSWLSLRDEGTILLEIRNGSDKPISGTVLLQPEGQNLIRITPAVDHEDRCSPHCSWGPLTSQGGLNQAVFEWQLHTPARSDLPKVALWKLRVDYCTQSLDPYQEPKCDHQIISINMIRVMFRMWGLLNEQPLVTVISVIFGMVYAIIQIMISNLLMNKSSAVTTQASSLTR